MTFFSALILGLLASAHCAGMCGGLQTVLQQPMVLRSQNEALQHLLALNLGRLSTYVAAGVLFSAFGAAIIGSIDVPGIARLARQFSALILITIGVQLLLSNNKPFAWIEKYGISLWQKVSHYLPKQGDNKLSRSFYRGGIWGFLPCGLIYSVLATTLFATNATQGGLTMLGFGLGTMPALLLTGGVYQQYRRAVRKRGVQWVGGIVFIQGGLLMLAAPYLVSHNFMSGYPQLMSSLFCLS